MGKSTLLALAAVGVLAFTPQYGVASIATGTGAPAAGLCTTQRVSHLYVDISSGRLYSCDTNGTWKGSATEADVNAIVVPPPPPGAGLPAGAIIFVSSGVCPQGTEEATELNGRVVLGTLAANGDVGGTGGSDTVTPAGNVSPQTFAGEPIVDVINHGHPVPITDPGHSHGTQRYPTATGGNSSYTIDTSMSGTPAANTLGTASAQTGITASASNPVGGVPSITPAGTVSQATFAGTQFDNRSAFIRVIACRAS